MLIIDKFHTYLHWKRIFMCFDNHITGRPPSHSFYTCAELKLHILFFSFQTLADKVILKGVLSLECNLETCTKRCLNRGAMGSGRSDDNLESLKKRHETHLNQTLPIINFYEAQGLVYKIDGSKSPDEVFADVKQIFPKIGW